MKGSVHKCIVYDKNIMLTLVPETISTPFQVKRFNHGDEAKSRISFLVFDSQVFVHLNETLKSII